MPKNKEKKRLLLTFDYELFLGRISGTVDKCLIEPTELILDTLDLHNTKAIFFVDATYLAKLKEVINHYDNAASDYKKIKKQLQKIIKKEHIIYLHIHPHWIDAKYNHEANQWNLENNLRYAFTNLDYNDKKNIFSTSFFALQEIISEVMPDYKIEGYRAGGLFIEPFHEIKQQFKEFDIKYDFSVLRGFYSKQKNYSFDFKNVPEKSIYHFEDSVVIEEKNGSFKEFSIEAVQIHPITRIANSFWYRFSHKLMKVRKIGNGVSDSHKLYHEENSTNLFKKKYETMSLELINSVKVFSYLKHVKNNKLTHFISHPKLITRSSISAFKMFLSQVYRNYEIDTNFKNW